MNTRIMKYALRGPAAVSAVLLAGAVQAAGVPGQGTWQTSLQPRDLDGDHVVDAYYDTDLNITWLRNADVNGQMDWASANAWANNLRAGGLSGWRLPTMLDTGAPGCDISFTGGTDCGYNVQTQSGATVYSEMAHLWYVTLGNKGYYDTAGNPEQPGWGLTNTGGFQNLEAQIYWAGLATAPDPNFAWDFYADMGFQYTAFNLSTFDAMAVRPGDVAAVPEPRSALMWLGGLMSLAVFRFRKSAPGALRAGTRGNATRRRLNRLLAALGLAMYSGVSFAAAYSGVYIFGDSLSDSGNDAVVVGANPGQVITGNSYIPSQPYASGQFSNGDVWVKSFTASLGLAASGAPSLGGGNNFAFGGARVATNGADLPPSLASQASMFLDAAGGKAPSQALYIVEGGGNDARDTLVAAGASNDPGAVIADAAAAYGQSIGQIVDQLQAAGAQQIIVWNEPNIGLAPAVTTQGEDAVALASQISIAMNGALSARLSFEAGVHIFDVYDLENAFAANPAAYGFANVTDACGAIAGCDPSTYLFWDGVHPTSAGHALLAQGMLAAVPEPASGALLLGGLLLLQRRIRRKA